jgi:hypothetical protein
MTTSVFYHECFSVPKIEVFPPAVVLYFIAMKTRNLFLSASLFALLVQVTGAASPSPSTSDKAAPDSKPVAVSPDNPESALKQAMAADAVRQIMGQPEEIKPMKAPNGKAEIWVYKRQFNRRVERVQIGTIPITTTVVGSDGIARQQTIGEDIKFGDLHRVTEETVEVLMFNDHYVTHKITRQELKHYS